MRKIIIGSKAMITENQIKDRKRMGSKYFEAHTTMDWFSNASISEYKKLLNNSGMTCYSMHAPIRDEVSTVSIGVADKARNERMVRYAKITLEYAEELCEIEKPIVVIHCEECIELNESFDLKRVSQVANKSKEMVLKGLEDVLEEKYKK